MRLIERKGQKEHKKTFLMFTLKMEEDDDIWNLYNFIDKGDFIKGKITRKITQEGTLGSERKALTIIIKIEELDYDPDSSSIRIRGKNVSEGKFIQVGQYQSMEIDKSSTVTIIKHSWDEIYEERLKMATDPCAYSDLAVVLMEEGISHLFLVAKNVTYLKAKIEHSLPKKKTKAVAHGKFEKAQETFFNKIISAMLKNVNFEMVKTIILASPGFVKDDFMTFLNESFEKGLYPELRNRKEMFMLEHSSSGFKHSLKELLLNKEVQDKLSNSSAISEAKVLENFQEMLRKSPEKAAYGKAWVAKAVEQGAVTVLLMTDRIFKAKSYTERSKYVNMRKSVETKGGECYIFSSMHPTGESLNDLTGIAAILKFAVPEEDEVEEAKQTAADLEEDKEKDEEDKAPDGDLGKLLSGLSVEGKEEDINSGMGAPQPFEEDKGEIVEQNEGEEDKEIFEEKKEGKKKESKKRPNVKVPKKEKTKTKREFMEKRDRKASGPEGSQEEDFM